jgi:hypothetical protein
MRAIITFGVLGLWAIVGCGGYEPAAPPPAAPGSQQAKAPAAPKPAAAAARPSAPTQSGMTTNMAAASAAAGVAPMDLMGGPQNVQPARPSQPAPPPANVEKAQAGVGKQGRDYGGGAIMAPITVPVRTYFQARDRITFLQVDDGMRLYKAANGSAPKTHEEFMEKIIKEGQIKLPALPPGDRYIYIPAKEELCVEHTQRQ